MQHPRRQHNRQPRKAPVEEWTPRTNLGKSVASGDITNIDQILEKGIPIRESEIVDALVQDLEEQVIPIGKAGRPFNMVQRMTDSGRRNNFLVVAAVGNRAGYLGVGEGRAKEYGPALRKAIGRAKRNLIKVPRGCGSWECSCSSGHSVPFRVEGKTGSVRIIVKPAPKGIGIASNSTSKILLSLAGYSDIWTKTYGHTNSRLNLARATYNALNALSRMKAADISRYMKTPEPVQELAKEIDEARGLPAGKPKAEEEQTEPKKADKPEQKTGQKEDKPETKEEKKPSKPKKEEKPSKPEKEAKK